MPDEIFPSYSNRDNWMWKEVLERVVSRNWGALDGSSDEQNRFGYSLPSLPCGTWDTPSV